MKRILKTLILSSMMIYTTVAQAQSQGVMFLAKQHCMVRADEGRRYILLPVEEKAENCNIRLMAESQVVKTLNVRLAVDNIDYYVPVDLKPCDGKPALLDIHINGHERQTVQTNEYVCWKTMKATDTFDIANRERLRPVYHHSPAWGWMNDPNGLFYKDGQWHLFYQWNPYGSQWENMHWGHSVSRDLVHWEQLGLGIEPDALGTVFSGCCVVDKDNTAGFGVGAVIAMYTSAGENQTQSMAYSIDGGKSFKKYDKNPVIVADVPDFRDPHIFKNEQTGLWNLILAAGQEMRIYTSTNLKDWKYESSFGTGYGSHDGVWECPDLFRLPVEGTNEYKWVLLCNINPGGPFGGSATQYFVGDFDGYTFKCDTPADSTLWLDYGKDHYATVSFDNAPDGRRVMIGWMSNWQYAAQVPTRQYRSANTIAREPFLFKEGKMTYCGSRPVPEMDALRGKPVLTATFKAGIKRINKMFKAPQGAYELVLKLTSKKGETMTITLSNTKGERVVLTYDEADSSIAVNRKQSGETTFSEFFPVETKTRVLGGGMTELRLFIDNSSVEAFVNGGRTVMTNTVFPSEPYNILTVQGKKGSKVQSLTIYNLNK